MQITTVGELKRILQDIPDDAPVEDYSYCHGSAGPLEVEVLIDKTDCIGLRVYTY